MGAMSWWHWVIVLVALVILFGSKKLPDAARGLGQSLRIFKSEVKEMQNDDKSESSSAATAESQRELPAGTDPAQRAGGATDDVKKSA